MTFLENDVKLDSSTDSDLVINNRIMKEKGKSYKNSVFLKKYTNKIFLLVMLAIILVFGMMFIGCGNNPANENGGGNLVLSPGWAWTNYFEFGEGESIGFIFRANGVLFRINNFNGPWVVERTYSYSVSSDIITVDGGGVPLSYSISGNTLNIERSVFKKTNVGINP